MKTHDLSQKKPFFFSIQQPPFSKKDELKTVEKTTSSTRTNLAPSIALGLQFAAYLHAVTGETLTFQDGVPPGGTDLCNGASQCFRGYVLNGHGALVAQFNRALQVLSKTDWGTQWLLNTCIDESLVGNAVITSLMALQANASDLILDSCTAQSLALNGYQAISELTNVTSQICNIYQANFQQQTNPCISQGDAAGYNWAIAAICFGIIGYCASMIAAGMGVAACCNK